MSKFIHKGSLIVGDGARLWIVDRPIAYASTIANRVIEIRSGFETDLASIPRTAQSIITPNGRERLAAVVHDFLYETQPRWCTRKLADQIFLEAMGVLGERWSRRWAMYLAVRVGGWIYWGTCAESKAR